MLNVGMIGYGKMGKIRHQVISKIKDIDEIYIKKFKIIYNFISNTYKFLHSKRIILPLNLTISLKSVNKSSRKKY